MMPSPGTLVRVKTGDLAVVAVVTPDGSGDAAWYVDHNLFGFAGDPQPIVVDDIEEILWEHG